MQEVKLPSGAVLKIGHTPFAVSLALNEAVLTELKSVDVTTETDSFDLFKNLLCIGFSSSLIKSCLWKCFERCTYNSGKGDFRIDANTFDPIESREDYAEVCMEVAKYNIIPFVKTHSAKFSQILEVVKNSQKSEQKMTQS